MSLPQAAVSQHSDVLDMYEGMAAKYAAMMESEMSKSMYVTRLPDLLRRIRDTVADPCATRVVDVGCGSGDALVVLAAAAGAAGGEGGAVPMVGIEPSKAMRDAAAGKIAAAGLGEHITVMDGTCGTELEPGSACGILSYFVVHHLSMEEVEAMLCNWASGLVDGGQVLLGAWEGDGPIDYGDAASIVALLHPRKSLEDALAAAGFSVTDTAVELDEDFGMNMVFINAVKE